MAEGPSTASLFEVLLPGSRVTSADGKIGTAIGFAGAIDKVEGTSGPFRTGPPPVNVFFVEEPYPAKTSDYDAALVVKRALSDVRLAEEDGDRLDSRVRQGWWVKHKEHLGGDARVVVPAFPRTQEKLIRNPATATKKRKETTTTALSSNASGKGKTVPGTDERAKKRRKELKKAYKIAKLQLRLYDLTK